jgi:RNA-binding protein
MTEEKGGLAGSQRKYLRGLAHGLKPLVQVGKGGVTSALLAAVNRALDEHELIKVKFVDFKEEKKELSEEIGRKTKSERVGMIGNVAVFYRQHADPEKRKIRIPA